MGVSIIVPLNYSQEESFTVRRIITSRSDCLALEEQHQIVFLHRGAILYLEQDRQRIVRDRHLLLIPPGRGGEMRITGFSNISQICYDTTFLEFPPLLTGKRIQVFYFAEELASRVEMTFSQLLGEYKDKNPGYEQMIRLKMEELALLVERTLPRICSPESGAIVIGRVDDPTVE